MSTVAELSVAINADPSGFQSGMRQVDQGVSQMTHTLQSAAAAIAGLGLATIGKEIAGIGLEFLALKEQAQIAFGTMLQSGELAKSFLVELQAFAARTPFEFPDLIRAAQRMKAMGIAAGDVIPMLTAVGDAAAALGANAQTIDRITLALGQMFAKGKVSAEEMRQLAEAGIPAWQILADKLGITVPEAMKKAEKGLIDGKVAVKLLTDGIENGTKNVQAFGGMMEKQSHTFAGLASTIKDLGRQAIGDILQPAFDRLRDVMEKVTQVLPKAVEWFQNLSTETKNGVLAFGALVTLAPLVVGGIGLIATAIGALISPIGLVVLAIGALGVAYAANIGGLQTSISEFARAIEGVWSGHGENMKQITRDFWGEINSQVADNFHRIGELFQTATALIEGRWSDFFKHMLEIPLSFFDSLTQIFANIGEMIFGRIATWGGAVARFVVDSVRNIAGIKMDIPKGLEFKADVKLPGLDFGANAAADKMLTELDKKKTAAHGKAKALGQAVLDGFKEGVAGLEAAFALVATKTDEQLRNLFDQTTKSTRKGAQELKNALTAITTGINEFLDSFGAGIKLTKEQIDGFGTAFIGAFREPTIALKQAREGQVRELAELNRAFIQSNQDLRAVLKDGIIVIQTYGEDAAERIARNAVAADHAYSLNEVFAKANSGLIASLNDQNKIIISSGEIIAQSAHGVGVKIGDELGPKLASELKQGIDVAGEAMADAWIQQFTNLKRDTLLSSKETISIMLQAFAELNPKTQAILRPFVDNTVAQLSTLKAKVQDIKDQINKNPFFESLKIKQDAAQTFEGVIQIVEREGERLGQTQEQINATILTTMAKMRGTLPPEMQVIADKVTEAFKRGMDKLPGALDEIFNKLALGAKHAVSGIFDVINNIPGKFGDALRKSTSELTKWVDQIDGILKGLHKIFASIPDGLADALGKVTGIVKSTKPILDGFGSDWLKVGQIGKTSASTVASSWSKASDGMKVTLGAAAGAFATLTASMAVTSATGSKTAGFLTSLFGSTMAGIQAGLAFGPVGGAIVGGVSLIGGIIGMFMGKSSAQKEQERIAAEKVKVDMQQAAQNVVKSAIEGFQKGLEFLEQLDEFTQVRKEKFRAFFANFSKLIDYFLELAKKWSGESLAAAKAFAESIGPVVGVVLAAVESLDALAGFGGVAEKAIVKFGDALALTLAEFIAVMETFEDMSLIKRARKFAERIGEVISVIGSAVLAFMGSEDQPGLNAYSSIPAEVFDAFAADLKVAVAKMGEIADSIDSGMVKQAQKFADKVKSVVDVISGAMVAFLGQGAASDHPGLASYAKIPIEVFDMFFADLLIATNKMAEITEAIDTTMLSQAQVFAEKSSAVFKAIGEGVKAFTALHDYKAIPAEAMQAFTDDFERAILLITVLMNRVDDFLALAQAFEEKIVAAAGHLQDGVHTFADIIVDAIAILNGAFGALGGGAFPSVPPAAGAAGLPALASGGFIQSEGLAYLHAGEQVVPAARVQGGASSNVTVNVTVQGSLVHESRLQDVVVRAIEQAGRRGRLATI